MARRTKTRLLEKRERDKDPHQLAAAPGEGTGPVGERQTNTQDVRPATPSASARRQPRAPALAATPCASSPQLSCAAARAAAAQIRCIAPCAGFPLPHSSAGVPFAGASRPPQRTTRGRVRAALRPRRGRLKNPAQRARISAALRQSGCAAGATHPSPTVPGAVLPRRAPRSLSAAAQPHDGMELRAADAHRGAPGGDEGLPRAMGASPAPRPARRVRHTAPRRLRPRFSLPDFRRRARAREFSIKTGKRACLKRCGVSVVQKL